MHLKSTSLISAAFLLAMLLPGNALLYAQPKPGYSPSSTHLYPAGGRRGTKVNVLVGAECIPPGTNFHIVGKGTKAPAVLGERVDIVGEPSLRRRPTIIPITFPRDWQSVVEIADDAPLGPAYWRISCAQGGTGSRPFIIGDLPEFIETESNSAPEKAERIELPVTVNGRINGERDVDYYRFHAKPGDVVVCEVLARRLGSRLDPIVELLDESGQRVPFEEIHVGNDPVLAMAVQSPGEFLLRIANVTFHGSPGHVYRINLSTNPYIPFTYPAGGQAGSQRDVELFALSGTGVPRTIKQSVKFPKAAGELLRLHDPNRLMNDIGFVVDDIPNTTETEPNNSATSAMSLAVPQTIDGRFLTADDEDWFHFFAKKNDRIAISCSAVPVGTNALPNIALTNADGKVLAKSSSVDSVDRDCYIEWTAPQDGTYHVQVRDLRYGAQGGLDFIYRLSIQHPAPNFSLTLDSDNINLVQGKTSQLQVTLKRFGGFDGPVDLVFEGLPEGITIDKPQIPAKATQAKLTLTATDNVRTHSTTLKLVGRAMIDDKPVEHTAQTRHLGIDSEGVAIASSTLDRLHLTVCHKPVFRLFCGEAYLYAHRGSIYPYLMEFERLNGFDGEITLQMADRQNRDPDGIEMIPVIVGSDESQAWLPIYLPETMHINVQSQSQLYSQAYATFTDKHNQRQSVLVLAEKRNMLRTLPPVVKLKAVDEERIVTSGSKVVCRLRLERTSNFPGPMTLKLISPAPETGISIETVTIAVGQTIIEVPVRIDVRLPAGATKTIHFRATGDLDGKSTIVTEATVRLRFE